MGKTDKIIIGIDPDIKKSGMATFYKGELLVETLPFPELIEKLYMLSTLPDDVLVVVEAGWLNEKSNFHGQHSGKAERIAKNVGSNHQTGRHIVEMAKHFGLEVIEHKPLNKEWKGPGGKITQDELNYTLQQNGIPEIARSNQDARDAALLAILYAKLVIRVRV